jgi:signal transduction histidine kinase
MKTSRKIRSLASRPVGGIRDVSAVDLLIAALLSVWAVLLTSGALKTGHKTGVGEAIGVLVMTVPVAWRRRAPISAAGTIAVGAVANAVLFDSVVRCGPCLPAAFFISFEVGAQLRRRRSMVGLGLVLVNIVAQAFSDPQLGGSTVILFVPAAVGFFALGRLAASRAALARELREKNVRLQKQREQTARLAVMNDRARVAGDLDEFLHDQVAEIAETAAAARASVASDPESANAAFAVVQNEGRSALARMREVVGSLRDEGADEPQPTLLQLSDLLDRATTANARLTVEGSPRLLPSGVELSGYRIVEHLLMAMDDGPGADIDVRLSFSPDALELHLMGPAAHHIDLPAVVAAARQRAALYGGTVGAVANAGRCTAYARLPLVGNYA